MFRENNGFGKIKGKGEKDGGREGERKRGGDFRASEIIKEGIVSSYLVKLKSGKACQSM